MAQARISLEPGLAQLHSFPGQTAPTSGPGASARRGYSERNWLLQTRRSSAAEKRGAKALRGIRVQNAERTRLCPGEQGTAGGASAPGAPRLAASEDTRPQRSGEVHLHNYQARRHAHPQTLKKQRPPGATHAYAASAGLIHAPPRWKGAAQPRDTPRQELSLQALCPGPASAEHSTAPQLWCEAESARLMRGNSAARRTKGSALPSRL